MRIKEMETLLRKVDKLIKQLESDVSILKEDRARLVKILADRKLK